jgi:glycosyltransferase involved in cell wall biosynthesis
MVTPYAPNRDGIAAYAVQAVGALLRAGHDVEVLSPGPSAGHHHLDLQGPRGALALARRVRGYDKLIVQFHPDVFYRVPAAPAEMIGTSLALTAVFRRAAEVEVRLHEIDYRWGQGRGPVARAQRALWRAADLVTVHTEMERNRLIEAFGVDPRRVTIADHGADFVRKTGYDRATARATLGLPADAFVFLSLGFLQPHKGFDRAIRAFAATGLATGGAQLEVAGSVRLDEPEFAAHVEELEELAGATEGVHLHRGYLSDELFDRWLVACDVVVLPYRHIWSSGVLERAALYDRPVVATRMGGLEQQGAGSGRQVTLVDDGPGFEADLAAALRSAAGAGAPGSGADQLECLPWPARDRLAIQQEVLARAASRRGAQPLRSRPAAPEGAFAPSKSSAPVRRLPPLALPRPTSTRVSARVIKQGVRRLTAWETDPVVWQLNALREATIRALDASGAEGGTPGGGPPPNAS